ncbi:MAG: hypothetical protein WC735_03325 [Candidatus Paceibacterota bacterium]
MATLVIVGGGYVAYNIYKLAQRLNRPPPVGQETNEVRIFIPGGGVTNITSASWQDQRIWFEWVDESNLPPAVSIVSSSSSGQGLRSTSFTPIMAQTQTQAVAIISPVVYATLNETGRVALALLFEKDTDLKPVSFQDLGMPVDEAGIPNLSWSVGQPPVDTEGVLAGLERSTNLVDWVPIIDWRVRSGFTNTFRDSYSSPNVFYRSVPR